MNLDWRVVTTVFMGAWILGTLTLRVRSSELAKRLEVAQWLLCPNCESKIEGKTGEWHCIKCGLRSSVEHPKNLWIAKFAKAHCIHAVRVASRP